MCLSLLKVRMGAGVKQIVEHFPVFKFSHGKRGQNWKFFGRNHFHADIYIYIWIKILMNSEQKKKSYFNCVQKAYLTPIIYALPKKCSCIFRRHIFHAENFMSTKLSRFQPENVKSHTKQCQIDMFTQNSLKWLCHYV